MTRKFIILDFISFISIFVNAGLICFTIQVLDVNKRYMAFAIMVIAFLTLKYFVRVIVPDVPEKTLTLKKRHLTVEEKVVKGFKRRNQGIIKNEKVSMDIEGISAANEEIMAKITRRKSIEMEEALEESNSKKHSKRKSIAASPGKRKRASVLE